MNVPPLELGRLRLPGLVLRQLRLRLLEIVTLQERAAGAGLPVDREAKQPRVRPRPLQIGVERGRELGVGGLAVVTVPAPDPVQLAQALRGVVLVGRLARDRHDPLALLQRVLELLAAELGGERAGTDDEDKALGLVDAGVDVLLELRGRGDVLPVDPDLPAGIAQERVQLADEDGVLARIRDKSTRPIGGRP